MAGLVPFQGIATWPPGRPAGAGVHPTLMRMGGARQRPRHRHVRSLMATLFPVGRAGMHAGMPPVIAASRPFRRPSGMASGLLLALALALPAGAADAPAPVPAVPGPPTPPQPGAPAVQVAPPAASPAQIAIANAAISQNHLRAGEVDRPMVFWEPAPGNDSHAAAAIITAVAPGSLAQQAGFQVKERVLSIDGCRMHDLLEIHLYQDVLPVDRETERWTVMRGDSRLDLTITGLDASANLGFTAEADPAGLDAGTLLTRAGMKLTAHDQAALAELPGRMVHALQDWLIEQHLDRDPAQAATPAAPLPGWLSTFALTAAKMLRGDDELPPPVAIPVPLLARLDGFYRAMSLMRRTNGPLPDLRTWGMDRFTLALWFPYSQDQLLPRLLRRYALRDRALRDLLTAKSPGGSLSQVMHSHPSLVTAAVIADQEDAREDEQLRDLCEQLNDLAWSLACDQRLLDPVEALAVAQDMVHTRGRMLSAEEKDTVAAAYARAGDVAQAVCWQQAAARECSAEERTAFNERIALYQAGMPLTDHSASLRPVRHAYGDGSVRLEGFMDGETRAGHWRSFHPGGTLVAEGTMLNGLPYGRWTTYTATGVANGQGWVMKGHRVGRWRTLAPDGSVTSSGNYMVADGLEVRVGHWEWYYPSGTVKEAGLFIDGRRSGLWKAFAPDGSETGSDHFIAGRPENQGIAGLSVPEALEPTTLEPPQVGDNSF